MTCWEGERALSTSSPMAFSLMFSMSCLTTRKLTSASSNAMRISRRALSMFSAVSLPSPRRFLKTRCSFSDRLSNMDAVHVRTDCAAETLRRFPYYNRLSRSRSGWGCDAQAAGCHFTGAVHPELIQDTGARPQVRGQAFGQPRDMKEDIAAAIVGPEKAEAFGFEISDNTARLLAGRGLAGVAGLAGAWRPAALVTDTLLDQGQIVVGELRGGECFGGNLEVRIPFPGLIKQTFLTCVQTKKPLES